MHVERAPTLEVIDARAMMKALEVPRDPREVREYLHWDKLRRLTPPADLTPEEWWMKIKFERRSGLRPLPLLDANNVSGALEGGEPFVYNLPDLVLRSLHRIDQRCAGEVVMDEVVTSARPGRASATSSTP